VEHTKQSTLNSLVEFYTSHYNIFAIFLTGSQAKNMARPDSDWDLHIAYSGEIPPSLVLEGDIITDVKTIELSKIESSIIETPYSPAVPFIQMYVRQGYEKIVVDLEKRTLDVYQKGPVAWSNVIYEDKRQQMFRFLKAVEGTASQPAICIRHMSKFYDLALNYWFLIRNRWSVSTYQALDIYKKEDPDFYQAIIHFSEADSFKRRVLACSEIYLILFPSTN
jgi:hypothetical protein